MSSCQKITKKDDCLLKKRGFTVAKHSRLGVDAIQVEIAKKFRVKKAAKRKKLTRNIRKFLEEYKNST